MPKLSKWERYSFRCRDTQCDVNSRSKAWTPVRPDGPLGKIVRETEFWDINWPDKIEAGSDDGEIRLR